MTMLLSRKLNIFSILTCVGVVFVTISFVSPGLVNCKLSSIRSLMVYSDQPGDPKEAHLSAGLWYFTLCIQRLSWAGSVREEHCHLGTYPFNIETPFSNPAYKIFRGKQPGTERLLCSPYFVVAVCYIWHSDKNEPDIDLILP